MTDYNDSYITSEYERRTANRRNIKIAGQPRSNSVVSNTDKYDEHDDFSYEDITYDYNKDLSEKSYENDYLLGTESVECDVSELIRNLERDKKYIEEAEEIYRKIAELKEKNSRLKSKLFFRKDIIIKLVGSIFVMFLTVFIFISTLKDSEIYYVLEEHIYELDIITDLLINIYEDSLLFFINTVLCALFDSVFVSLLFIFSPALIKLIILGINSINIDINRKRGKALISENIKPVNGYSLNYMCTFAINYFLGYYNDNPGADFNEIASEFNRYVRTMNALKIISGIAPMLKEMRQDLAELGYKK